MAEFIPYGKQTIGSEDLAAVKAVLASDFLTCGPGVEAFEEAFAAYVGAKHAVAVNSATAALHLAMLAAEIGPGDRVVTSPNTFLASANCAAYVGATPDFADIDPTTYNLSADNLASAWRDDTRAVVAVAYAGQPCDMPAVAGVARERGAVVIEDACHGVGTRFASGGEVYRLGGHPWADMSVFSFHPVKTMTTGEGGMLVTDDARYAGRARLLRSHGIERDPAKFRGFGGGDILGEQGPWVYEMHSLGFNYRITDLQCSLGVAQLSRLDEFIARRQTIVARYQSAFADLPFLQIPFYGFPLEDLSLHLYTPLFDFGALGLSRTAVMGRLRDRGVGSQVLYIPVYLQPYYRERFGYRPGKCPAAENYYAQCLSLPLFPAMSDSDIERVIEAVRDLAK